MVDRISKLPDDVLCHILSFLPSEIAVATGVLSKRWRPLWLSLPTLDFDEGRFLSSSKRRSRNSFIHFVYATIFARGLHQPIKTLRFKSYSGIPDIKIWLTAAIQREVESIEIMFNPLPFRRFNIFSCKTLIVLKLSFVSFSPFTSLVHLPSLKTLHLTSTGFSNRQDFMELLYGCPVLENMQLTDVYCTASSPFEILRLDAFFDFNLKSVVFPKLIHLEIVLGGSVNWNFVLDLLSSCPKLQTFVLEDLSRADEVWPNSHVVPDCFSSHLQKCFLKNFTGLEFEMRFAKFVMRNSMSLRTMTICSMPESNEQIKLEMIAELASCPRSSAACELVFK